MLLHYITLHYITLHYIDVLFLNTWHRFLWLFQIGTGDPCMHDEMSHNILWKCVATSKFCMHSNSSVDKGTGNTTSRTITYLLPEIHVKSIDVWLDHCFHQAKQFSLMLMLHSAISYLWISWKQCSTSRIDSRHETLLQTWKITIYIKV